MPKTLPPAIKDKAIVIKDSHATLLLSATKPLLHRSTNIAIKDSIEKTASAKAIKDKYRKTKDKTLERSKTKTKTATAKTKDSHC
jgi:hypothetical protein